VPPTKQKSRFQRNLGPPNTFLREINAIITNKDIVEEANKEQLFFGGGPSKLVFTFLSYSNGVQEIEKRGKDIHLSIMNCYSKTLMSHRFEPPESSK